MHNIIIMISIIMVLLFILIHSVLCCTDSRPNQPVNSKQKSWSNLLQLACLLMTLLETIQTVASSVIFYQILKSGDVEQNPGPGIVIINLSVCFF